MDIESAFVHTPFIQLVFREFQSALKGGRIVANFITLLGSLIQSLFVYFDLDPELAAFGIPFKVG
jgi:hypothetical protein